MGDIKLDSLEIGDVTYTFVEGEFFKTEAYARKLLGFADGIVEIKMIENGKEVRLPCRMGTIQIVKHKPKEYTGKSLRIDYALS